MTTTYPISNCFPDYDLDSQIVCHEADDYMAFLRQPTYAPLRRIVGAYASFFILFIDFGHYKTSALWFTTVVVWCAAWFVEVVEEGLFIAGLPIKVYWDPGSTLVAQPLMIGVGIGLGWLFVSATNPRPMLTPEASAAWLRRIVQSTIVVFAPSLPLLLRTETELYLEGEVARLDWWLAFVVQAVALVVCAAWNRWADGRLEFAHWGVFMASFALLWVLCVVLYHTAYMVALIATLYASIFILAMARTQWARSHRETEKSRYAHMVRRRADFDETAAGQAIYAHEWKE